ncbi:dynein axonemal heavy chain 11-like [Columba livia]|uniref:dynein axonemal heavy chain 11-like n=1 Tax=Columba livia TaxID=8932 RepID=UPI0031BAFB30
MEFSYEEHHRNGAPLLKTDGQLLQTLDHNQVLHYSNPFSALNNEMCSYGTSQHRPCAMAVPDIELICEMMLIAEQFIATRLLAKKLINLYILCRELLPKQLWSAAIVEAGRKGKAVNVKQPQKKEEEGCKSLCVIK